MQAAAAQEAGHHEQFDGSDFPVGHPEAGHPLVNVTAVGLVPHRSRRNDQVRDRTAGPAVIGEDQEKERRKTPRPPPPASPSIPSRP